LGVYRAEFRTSTMPIVRDFLFSLSLAAFAAIGLPVTFLSSLGGFLRTVQRASAERVGEAIDRGTAVGLVPGIVLATLVLATGIRT
jgi:hypothetical protein